MLELCMTSTFSVILVFLDFWQEGLGIYQMWCSDRMGQKEHCCIGPIFWCFLMPWLVSSIFHFWGTAYHRDSKPMPLDLHRGDLSISMHFSQSKSTKCDIFAWNFDFSVTTYCRDSKPAPLDLACLKPWICTTQTISRSTAA